MAEQFAKLSDINILSSDVSLPSISEAARVQLGEFAGMGIAAAKATLAIGEPVPYVETSEQAEATNFFGDAAGFGTPTEKGVIGVLSHGQGNHGLGTIQVHQGLFAKNWLREPIVFVRNQIPGTRDLAARISGFLDVYEEDISASVFPFTLQDLPLSMTPVPPVDLSASAAVNLAINLPAFLQTIESKDLIAFAGAHPPADLSANVTVHLPEDLSASALPVLSDILDLQASIIQVGGFKDMSVFFRLVATDSKDLEARILPRCPSDLTATLHGYDVLDLPASIITQRIKDMRVIIRGFSRENESTLRGVVRINFPGSLDLPVEPMKAVVSTHTSDFDFNLDRVQTRFFGNQLLFGTKRGGAFKFILEPVYGHFPDLHADIFARGLSISDLRVSIRPSFSAYKDISSSTVAVSSAINIDKISLSLAPLKNLNASIIQRGGFKGLRNIITGVVKASTGTADDAGFQTTETSYRFLLGSTRGLVIPGLNLPVIIVSSYVNNINLPDLHGTISGWVESNLSAYIKEYRFVGLPAALVAQDLSFLSNLAASIASFRSDDMPASVTSTGYLQALPASITVGGGVSDLTTFIQSYIDPLSYNVVPVSTKPFKDLFATINYESYVRCALRSGSNNLSAFVKVVAGGTEDTRVNLSAFLNVLRIQLDMPASVEPRKRTRIRTLSLTFRTGSRHSEGINTVIVPLRSTQSSLLSSIIGKSHEFDLPTDINPVSYRTTKPLTTLSEVVTKLDGSELSTTIMVALRAQVSSYVYEEISSKVYSTDQGKWSIDLRTADTQEGFFDSAENKKLEIDDVSEYNTLDEAIRAGIVILTEQRQHNLAASLNVLGQAVDLPVYLRAYGEDNLEDLSSLVTVVSNLPDITASINTGLRSSAFGVLSGIIQPENVETASDMKSDIIGIVSDDLSASLTIS